MKELFNGSDEDQRHAYQFVIDNGIVCFDNYNKENGISKSYTGGRGEDGALNGTLASHDIDSIIFLFCNFGWYVNTVIVHHNMLNIMGLKSLQKALHWHGPIVASSAVPYNAEANLYDIAFVNIDNLTQALIVTGIKIYEKPIEYMPVHSPNIIDLKNPPKPIYDVLKHAMDISGPPDVSGFRPISSVSHQDYMEGIQYLKKTGFLEDVDYIKVKYE